MAWLWRARCNGNALDLVATVAACVHATHEHAPWGRLLLRGCSSISAIELQCIGATIVLTTVAWGFRKVCLAARGNRATCRCKHHVPSAGTEEARVITASMFISFIKHCACYTHVAESCTRRFPQPGSAVSISGVITQVLYCRTRGSVRFAPIQL